MAEKEKMNSEALEKVAGGVFNPIDNLFRNPLTKYVCEECGHEFKFRQPGDSLHKGAVWVKCPKCGSHNLRDVCEISERKGMVKMSDKERMGSEELEKVAGGNDLERTKKLGRITSEELFKGIVPTKHDKNGDYSERVCRYCGKTFRCDEYMLMVKMTPKQLANYDYCHRTCPECREIHPFEFSE